jgi:hypothetical protein
MRRTNSTRRWLIASLAALLIGLGLNSTPMLAQISPLPSPLETPHRPTPTGVLPPPVSAITPIPRASRRQVPQPATLVFEPAAPAQVFAATATPVVIRTRPRVVPFRHPISMLLWRFHNWNK